MAPEGPGRPQIGPMVNVRLVDDLIVHLDNIATHNGIGRAELIRRLIAGALAVAYDDDPTARRLLREMVEGLGARS